MKFWYVWLRKKHFKLLQLSWDFLALFCSHVRIWIFNFKNFPVSICYVARYADVWNRHRESEIHNIHEIGSGTKLYYLWVKSYSTWRERERQNLSMLTVFTSAPNHVQHPTCKLLGWPRRAPKVNLPVQTQELN